MSASGHEADVKQSTGFEFRRERQPDALYKTDKILGKGRFSQIWSAFPQPGTAAATDGVQVGSKPGRVAMKLLAKNKLKDKSAMKGLKIEVQIMHTLERPLAPAPYLAESLPHVAMLLDTFESHRGVHMVTQYAAGGTLQAFVRRVHHLPQAMARSVFRQAAQAVHYIHSCGVVHREVTAENLLLANADSAASAIDAQYERTSLLQRNGATDSSGERIPVPYPLVGRCVKLNDYGTAARVLLPAHGGGTRRRGLKTRVGDPQYMAPEVVSVRDIGEYAGEPADIWGLGVLLWLLLTGECPFRGGTPLDIMRAVQSEALPWDKYTSTAALQLAKSWRHVQVPGGPPPVPPSMPVVRQRFNEAGARVLTQADDDAMSEASSTGGQEAASAERDSSERSGGMPDFSPSDDEEEGGAGGDAVTAVVESASKRRPSAADADVAAAEAMARRRTEAAAAAKGGKGGSERFQDLREEWCPALVHLLLGLLTRDPDRRPTVLEVLQHPWVCGQDSLPAGAPPPRPAGYNVDELDFEYTSARTQSTATAKTGFGASIGGGPSVITSAPPGQAATDASGTQDVMAALRNLRAGKQGGASGSVPADELLRRLREDTSETSLHTPSGGGGSSSSPRSTGGGGGGGGATPTRSPSMRSEGKASPSARSSSGAPSSPRSAAGGLNGGAGTVSAEALLAKLKAEGSTGKKKGGRKPWDFKTPSPKKGGVSPSAVRNSTGLKSSASTASVTSARSASPRPTVKRTTTSGTGGSGSTASGGPVPASELIKQLKASPKRGGKPKAGGAAASGGGGSSSRTPTRTMSMRVGGGGGAGKSPSQPVPASELLAQLKASSGGKKPRKGGEGGDKSPSTARPKLGIAGGSSPVAPKSSEAPAPSPTTRAALKTVMSRNKMRYSEDHGSVRADELLQRLGSGRASEHTAGGRASNGSFATLSGVVDVTAVDDASDTSDEEEAAGGAAAAPGQGEEDDAKKAMLKRLSEQARKGRSGNVVPADQLLKRLGSMHVESGVDAKKVMAKLMHADDEFAVKDTGSVGGASAATGGSAEEQRAAMMARLSAAAKEGKGGTVKAEDLLRKLSRGDSMRSSGSGERGVGKASRLMQARERRAAKDGGGRSSGRFIGGVAANVKPLEGSAQDVAKTAGPVKGGSKGISRSSSMWAGKAKVDRGGNRDGWEILQTERPSDSGAAASGGGGAGGGGSEEQRSAMMARLSAAAKEGKGGTVKAEDLLRKLSRGNSMRSIGSGGRGGKWVGGAPPLDASPAKNATSPPDKRTVEDDGGSVRSGGTSASKGGAVQAATLIAKLKRAASMRKGSKGLKRAESMYDKDGSIDGWAASEDAARMSEARKSSGGAGGTGGKKGTVKAEDLLRDLARSNSVRKDKPKRSSFSGARMGQASLESAASDGAAVKPERPTSGSARPPRGGLRPRGGVVDSRYMTSTGSAAAVKHGKASPGRDGTVDTTGQPDHSSPWEGGTGVHGGGSFRSGDGGDGGGLAGLDLDIAGHVDHHVEETGGDSDGDEGGSSSASGSFAHSSSKGSKASPKAGGSARSGDAAAHPLQMARLPSMIVRVKRKASGAKAKVAAAEAALSREGSASGSGSGPIAAVSAEVGMRAAQPSSSPPLHPPPGASHSAGFKDDMSEAGTISLGGAVSERGGDDHDDRHSRSDVSSTDGHSSLPPMHPPGMQHELSAVGIVEPSDEGMGAPAGHEAMASHGAAPPLVDSQPELQTEWTPSSAVGPSSAMSPVLESRGEDSDEADSPADGAATGKRGAPAEAFALNAAPLVDEAEGGAQNEEQVETKAGQYSPPQHQKPPLAPSASTKSVGSRSSGASGPSPKKGGVAKPDAPPAEPEAVNRGIHAPMSVHKGVDLLSWAPKINLRKTTSARAQERDEKPASPRNGLGGAAAAADVPAHEETLTNLRGKLFSGEAPSRGIVTHKDAAARRDSESGEAAPGGGDASPVHTLLPSAPKLTDEEWQARRMEKFQARRMTTKALLHVKSFAVGGSTGRQRWTGAVEAITGGGSFSGKPKGSLKDILGKMDADGKPGVFSAVQALMTKGSSNGFTSSGGGVAAETKTARDNASPGVSPSVIRAKSRQRMTRRRRRNYETHEGERSPAPVRSHSQPRTQGEEHVMNVVSEESHDTDDEVHPFGHEDAEHGPTMRSAASGTDLHRATTEDTVGSAQDVHSVTASDVMGGGSFSLRQGLAKSASGTSTALLQPPPVDTSAHKPPLAPNTGGAAEKNVDAFAALGGQGMDTGRSSTGGYSPVRAVRDGDEALAEGGGVPDGEGGAEELRGIHTVQYGTAARSGTHVISESGEGEGGRVSTPTGQHIQQDTEGGDDEIRGGLVTPAPPRDSALSEDASSMHSDESNDVFELSQADETGSAREGGGMSPPRASDAVGLQEGFTPVDNRAAAKALVAGHSANAPLTRRLPGGGYTRTVRHPPGSGSRGASRSSSSTSAGLGTVDNGDGVPVQADAPDLSVRGGSRGKAPLQVEDDTPLDLSEEVNSPQSTTAPAVEGGVDNATPWAPSDADQTRRGADAKGGRGDSAPDSKQAVNALPLDGDFLEGWEGTRLEQAIVVEGGALDLPIRSKAGRLGINANAAAPRGGGHMGTKRGGRGGSPPLQGGGLPRKVHATGRSQRYRRTSAPEQQLEHTAPGPGYLAHSGSEASIIPGPAAAQPSRWKGAPSPNAVSPSAYDFSDMLTARRVADPGVTQSQQERKTGEVSSYGSPSGSSPKQWGNIRGEGAAYDPPPSMLESTPRGGLPAPMASSRKGRGVGPPPPVGSPARRPVVQSPRTAASIVGGRTARQDPLRPGKAEQGPAGLALIPGDTMDASDLTALYREGGSPRGSSRGGSSRPSVAFTALARDKMETLLRGGQQGMPGHSAPWSDATQSYHTSPAIVFSADGSTALVSVRRDAIAGSQLLGPLAGPQGGGQAGDADVKGGIDPLVLSHGGVLESTLGGSNRQALGHDGRQLSLKSSSHSVPSLDLGSSARGGRQESKGGDDGASLSLGANTARPRLQGGGPQRHLGGSSTSRTAQNKGDNASPPLPGQQARAFVDFKDRRSVGAGAPRRVDPGRSDVAAAALLQMHWAAGERSAQSAGTRPSGRGVLATSGASVLQGGATKKGVKGGSKNKKRAGSRKRNSTKK